MFRTDGTNPHIIHLDCCIEYYDCEWRNASTHRSDPR